MLAGSPIDILPASIGTACDDQCAAKKEEMPIMARRPFLSSLSSFLSFSACDMPPMNPIGSNSGFPPTMILPGVPPFK